VVAGTEASTAHFASAVLGSFAAVILAAIAARLFETRGVAIGVGIAAALDPSLVMVGSDVPSESLSLVLLLGAGFLLLASVDRPSSTLSLAAGILTGLAIVTRPPVLFVAPFLAAPLGDRRWPFRVRAHIAAAGILGVVVSLAPWAIENAVVRREFVVASDVGGAEVFGIGALSAILCLLAGRGLFFAPRRGASVFAIAFLLASLAAHVLPPASWRDRVPDWEPVLVLYAVFGAGTLLPRWKPAT
jgi:4-amino-4-deoxy-L-arabinose transferase-like glycosyltransferase